MAVNPKPDEYNTVTSALQVDGAARLIEFMSKVFGATERMRMPGPDGKVMHAEVELGDSVVMVADAMSEWPATKSSLYVYTQDCDETYRKAIEAGATSVTEPSDQFYGDRSGAVDDSWGNRWTIATHVEDVSEEELQKRMREMAPA